MVVAKNALLLREDRTNRQDVDQILAKLEKSYKGVENAKLALIIRLLQLIQNHASKSANSMQQLIKSQNFLVLMVNVYLALIS